MQKLAVFSKNEPNKQELTRHLALLWRNLPPEEKQVNYTFIVLLTNIF